ncbi:MAG: hypothetical protein K8R36_00155 [Planctomycetales bacterium]|nr:hypothetical protein [Planctomycetales bacterium]
MKLSLRLVGLLLLLAIPAAALAEPPSASYIFPAGGSRGTKVSFRVGGMFLYDKAPLEMLGLGKTMPGK